MAYPSRDSQVQERQLKVQRMVIPFTVTHNATPASKTFTCDEPSLLFFNFEGITGLSTTTGAIETGETLPTLATATDSTGVINLLVKTNEVVSKVMSVKYVSRAAASGLSKPAVILAATTGSTNSGKSIVCNLTHGVNLSTTDLDGVIEVEYII